ncbi:MAG: radical SAM protein [Vicinamibacterales bacterium]
MNVLKRIARHTRLTMTNYADKPSPPFLVLFINSICNMKCEHCFYWTSLNQRDDLSKDEIFALSESLGRIENLNLSGGEPFLRKEFSEICRQFIRHNGVRQIYVPTNGWYKDKTIKAITETLEEPTLELFVAELSLDGMAAFHDAFRVAEGAFEKAMATYDALAELQQRDPRLRIHSISTATDVNVQEIRKLTEYLYERCPRMDHHNLALIRGDRKNPALKLPDMRAYADLYDYMRRLWQPREEGRYGSIVDPMLQWAKLETVARGTQVIPCRAGVLSAVVAANGDVSVCELHEPLGNLRKQTFWDIWNSEAAAKLRKSIAAKDCHCTTEVFLWPSIVFQPLPLAQSLVKARVWERVKPLEPGEMVELGSAGRQRDLDALAAGQTIAIRPVTEGHRGSSVHE